MSVLDGEALAAWRCFDGVGTGVSAYLLAVRIGRGGAGRRTASKCRAAATGRKRARRRRRSLRTWYFFLLSVLDRLLGTEAARNSSTVLAFVA